jgi:cytochrome c oxidase subunit 2
MVLFLPGCAPSAPPSPLLPASQSASEIAGLFYFVLAIAVVVFLLVEGLLIYAVFRYRRQEHSDEEEPEQVHGNATLEIMWTIVPAGIMVLLFVMTLRTLQAQRTIPNDAVQIKVTGHQWFWEFEYDNGVTGTDELRLPADTPVEFEITSNDVIHSFWVPQLGGKMDAIPGHTNYTWVHVTEPGTYAGQCAEYCGLEHYAMLFDAEVMPRDEFNAWLEEELASRGDVVGEDVPDMESVPEGDLAHGEQLFGELGCTACHTLDGSTLVGPSLEGIGARAAGRKEGYSAEQYLAESMILPCEHVVEGFTCVMPAFGNRLTEEDLAGLVAYLLEQ